MTFDLNASVLCYKSKSRTSVISMCHLKMSVFIVKLNVYHILLFMLLV